GRLWKEELKRKEDAGTLTVAERTRLNSGYYFDIADKFEYSIKTRAGNFSKPICDKKPTTWIQQAVNEDVTCKRPYVSVQEDQLVYEDDYSRWIFDRKKWDSAIDAEYDRL